MNSAYVLQGAAVLALEAGQLRSEWHGHSIPGDPSGRWLIIVSHVDDMDEQGLLSMPGVTQLPSMMDPSPLPPAWVTVLNRWGINVLATDTIAIAFDKLRAKWPKAAAVWR